MNRLSSFFRFSGRSQRSDLNPHRDHHFGASIRRKLTAVRDRFAATIIGRGLGWIWSWQPLTGRGVLVLLLGTIALRVFAIPEYDLIADILGTSALALLVLTVFASILIRVRLASRLRCEVRFDDSVALSRHPVPAGIVLWESSLPPFFSLRLKRQFTRAGITAPVHIIRGGQAPDEARHLLDGVTFPHRDLYDLSGIRCDLEDHLGITRLSWVVPIPVACEVSAETVYIAPLPVIAASSRAGDEQMQARERTGDLFDIKPYDPSDGIKRILWKTYAKSGQLVSRRPEPAIIPDGEVVIYLIAGPEDDVVAGACQGYVHQLIEHQVNVLFGTDGILGTDSSMSAAIRGSGIFSSLETIRHAINRTASHPDAGTGRGFADFLDALHTADRVVHQVIVFGPEDGGWFVPLARVAARHSLKLSVALVPAELDPQVTAQIVRYRRALRHAPRFIEKLPIPMRKGLGVIFPELRPLGSPPPTRAGIVEVARKIESSGGEVLVVQGRDSIA